MSRFGLAVWIPSAAMVGAVLATACVVKLVLEPIDNAMPEAMKAWAARLART